MTRHQNRRGFSLIEAAIVLAVVGLVIGGIWVAADSINRKMRLNEASRVALQAVEKTRQLYQNVQISNYAIVSHAVYVVGGIPSNWKDDGDVVVAPDGKIGFKILINQGIEISLQFDPIPMDYADCVNMIPMLTRTKDLIKVGGNMGSYTRANGKLPLSRSSIDELCEGASNYLELYYNR